MTRPTPIAVAAAAGSVPLAAIVIAAAPNLWGLIPVYIGVVGLLLGVDAIFALAPRRLAIETTTPPMLYIGDSEMLSITLDSSLSRARANIDLLCEVGADLDPPALTRAEVGPGQITEIAVPLTPRRRGTVRIERIWARWTGPLGLIRIQTVRPFGIEIPVVPNIKAVRGVAIRFFSRDSLFGVKVQRQQGDGTEFDSLRDYAPGLDHRAIDWKHSARHRKLVCKEFQSERNHQIILAFDTGHLMREPLAGAPKLDHAINAGLQLGYVSLRHGDRIGLFAFDSQVRHYLGPAGGPQAFTRLQHAAAGLEYRPEEVNYTLGLAELGARLQRRSLIILFTDFVDTITAELMLENIGRLTRRHLVAFLTLRDLDLDRLASVRPKTMSDVARAVVADQATRERRVVLERLNRLGAQCLDAAPNRIGSELINQYLDIKRREMI